MGTGKMKIAIRLIDDLGRPRDLVSLGILADRLGFDAVWFPNDSFRTNSWVLDSAVAGATERIELCAMANIWTTDPSEIATYIATLDDVSHGRASLSIGLHNYDSVTWVGKSAADAPRRIRESTEIVRRLLRGEVVHYQGEIYRWTEKAYLRMPPYRPDVPVLISPVGDDLLELSGEIGDGSLPMVTPPQSASVIVEPIRRGLQRSENPHRPFDLCAFVWMAIAEDRDEARNLLADIVAYFGTYLDPRALAMIGLTVEDYRPAYNAIVARDPVGARQALTSQHLKLGIYGTPEECVRQLEPIIEAGFNHVSIGGPLGRNPAEAMRLIAERVIPAFR
ncbi:MAG: LLM class flavin-dependent oxidoreductase [Chloroflexi bacterium]|nr:LLM class flavin-dependent oxidoreductase [Chloroflexota bacterium]